MLTRIRILGLALCVLIPAAASAPAQEGEKSKNPANDNDRASASKVTGELMSVQKEEVSIKGREGNAESFSVRPATTITLDGKQAKIEDLRKGDRVEATVGEGNVAQSLAATRTQKPGSVSGQPLPPARQVAQEGQSGADRGNRDPRTPRDPQGNGSRNSQSNGQNNDDSDRRALDRIDRRSGDNRETQDRDSGNRAELGVSLAPSRTIGTRVVGIDQESAAARAGLRAGDYILAINGEATNSPEEVQRAISGIGIGEDCKLSIWRNGETQDMTASLAERRRTAFRGFNDENNAGQASQGGENRDSNRNRPMPKIWLGVSLGNAPQGTDGALVRNVFPNDPAARAGFRSGDVIVGVNDDDVKDAGAFLETIDKMEAGKEVEFRVMRSGEKQTLKATLADRAEFFSSQGSNRGGQDAGNDDFSGHASMFEHNRRIAEQHQRLEERLDQVLQELQQIREQLGARGNAKPGNSSDAPRSK